MSNPKLIDDTTALTTIRQFLAAHNKHPDLLHIDCLVVTYLLSLKSEDHDVWPSQLTLARMFGVDTRTIARSLARLVKVGYISVQHRRGRTSLYSINSAAVPGQEALHEKVTQAARTLSHWYQQELVKGRHRKKFPKRWLAMQFLSAQRILDKCNGNAETAGKVILFALAAKQFQQKAAQSLYNLMTIWKPMATAYNAMRKEEQAKEAALLQMTPVPSTPPVVETQQAETQTESTTEATAA